MVVGTLRLELTVFGATSLKDKRRAILSVKDRLWRSFRVSVAEVDALDSWQRCVLGVAMASNESTHVHRCLDKIVEAVRRDRNVSLVSFEKELL